MSEFCVTSEMISGGTWMATFNFNPHQITVSCVLLLRKMFNRKKLKLI